MLAFVVWYIVSVAVLLHVGIRRGKTNETIGLVALLSIVASIVVVVLA
jgi:hypothetical protein